MKDLQNAPAPLPPKKERKNLATDGQWLVLWFPTLGYRPLYQSLL